MTDAAPKFVKSKMAGIPDVLAKMQRSDGFNRYKLEEGDNRIRVLPAYNELGEWFKYYRMHFNMPVDHKRKTWPCPGTDEQPCAFCESAEAMRNTEGWNMFRAKDRFSFNVIDPDNPSEVQLLDCGVSIAKDILAFAEREGDPTDPEDGYGFTIIKTKTGSSARDVEYTVHADRKNSRLPDWGVLDNLYDLDALVAFPDESTQAEVLGLTSGAEEPQHRELPPAATTSPAPTESPDVDAIREQVRQRLQGTRT